MLTPEQVQQLLKDCLMALNMAPRTRLRGCRFPDTYELAAELGWHVRAYEVNADVQPVAAFAPNDRRAADRVDGYDRDDLGESPDY